uniref:Kelch domain containing 3 n=1 Tax=Callorhinchus milii TaxID=7868 RepID=A0A4W3HQQ3_CALMI
MLRWAVHLEGGPRRVNHAAVAVGHKIYSFGGYCSGEDYETLRQIDVHVFNAVSLRWMKLPPYHSERRAHSPEVPYMRYGHTAVLVDDAIYVWGGRNDTEGACNVLYAFDISSHSWTTPRVGGVIPGARDGHSACALGKSMFIFGGYEQLRLRAAAEPRNIGPGRSRSAHQAYSTILIDQNKPSLLSNLLLRCVTGEWILMCPLNWDGPALLCNPSTLSTQADCFSNDIHKLDATMMAWSLINAKGNPARWRDFHSATVIGSRMYVFGGRADRFGPFHSNNEIYCNRIKVFDTETNHWLDSPTTQLLPEGRRSHSAFTHNGQLYIFGGYNARLDRHFNDLWKYSPGEGGRGANRQMCVRKEGTMWEGGVCCCSAFCLLLVWKKPLCVLGEPPVAGAWLHAGATDVCVCVCVWVGGRCERGAGGVCGGGG